MVFIVNVLFVFFSLFKLIIFVDIIFSWISPLGARFRYNFISPLLEPIYRAIKKIMPTTLGIFDFTPVVLLVIIMILEYGTIFLANML